MIATCTRVLAGVLAAIIGGAVAGLAAGGVWDRVRSGRMLRKVVYP